jgi:DNA-binding transcriptional ArsR family regulator
MTSKQETSGFIRSTFASVWSLELLLFLRRHADRAWAPSELVTALRGSEVLVARSLHSLFAAGLVDLGEDGTVRYRAASPELETLIDAAAAEYARSPDAVRRTIIAGAGGDLTAFADAFRFRRT